MTQTTQTISKGYKQTEIGVIPVDWDLVSLGKLCTYQNGTALEKYFNNATGFKVISIGNYSETGKFVETGSYIDRKHTKDLKKFVLNKNDLTMILNDKTAIGTIIGRVLYIEENDKYIFNQRTMRLTPKDNTDPLFLYFQINGGKTHKYIVNLSKPGTQIYVNTNDITELPIAIPKSKPEQIAIATALSDADTLIEKLEKLIAKKKAIKQGAMQQLLTGKKRLPGFSGEWAVKKLGEFLDYEQPTKYLVKDTEYSDDYKTPVLTAGKTFILGYTSEETGIFNDLPVIIFDDFTTANKFVDFPFKAKSSAMKMLKPRNKGINLRFLFEIMQLIDFKLGDHKRYWISEYQNLGIEIPKPEEQTAISTVLSDMDAEIEKLENKLNKYRQIKTGMMQQLLTGKIRLVKN